jgi:hypothetical protein
MSKPKSATLSMATARVRGHDQVATVKIFHDSINGRQEASKNDDVRVRVLIYPDYNPALSWNEVCPNVVAFIATC